MKGLTKAKIASKISPDLNIEYGFFLVKRKLNGHTVAAFKYVPVRYFLQSQKTFSVLVLCHAYAPGIAIIILHIMLIPSGRILIVLKLIMVRIKHQRHFIPLL